MTAATVMFSAMLSAPRTFLAAIAASFALLAIAAPSATAAPGFSSTPSSKAFGNIEPDFASIPQTFTISNPGTSTLTISSVSLGGADPGQFEITFNGCTAPVPAAGSCEIHVVFAPRSTGTKAALLRLVTNDSGSPHTIGLGGVGSEGGRQPDSAFKQSTGSPVPTANAPCDLVVGYIKNQKGASTLSTAQAADKRAPDLLLTDPITDQIEVRNGDGQGNFPTDAPRSPASTNGTRSCGVAVGDVDGDGRDEAIISNRDSDDLSVFDQENDGGLTPIPNLVPTGDDPETPELGDVDGDGDLDIVVPNTGDDDASVIENDGDGNFTPDPTPVPTGDEPGEGDLSDLDQDGDLDFVVPNTADDDVSILDNDGDGNFTPDPTPVPTGDQPLDAETGDMNEDGKPDAVISDYGDDQIEVLDNDGSGNLDPDPSPTPTDQGPTDIDLGDIDGDGKRDAAVVAEDDDKIDIYLGDGDGDFSEQPPGTPLDTGGDEPPLSLEDINEDGAVDIISTDEKGDVPLYLNRLDPDSAFREGLRLKAGKRQRFNRQGVRVWVYCHKACSLRLNGGGLRSRKRQIAANRWQMVFLRFTNTRRRTAARSLAAGRTPSVTVSVTSQGATKSRPISLLRPRDPQPVTG